ncbi:MAG: M42 family peptidase [Clostridia bacterium]|nr:M42 family peptidase [Clostridia bacterium]
MLNELKSLCALPGVSGREEKVREYIIEKIKDKAEIKVDALGNIIAFVKGRNRAVKRVMADAHMDEVGLIITDVTEGGFLKFATVGGIDVSVLMARRVIINGDIIGVISSKPVHLMSADEKKSMPLEESLYIDIGVKDKQEAMKLVSLGDVAVFSDAFQEVGELLVAKAIDDRAGCAVLIDIINSQPEYDFYATFSVLEEVGAGARTAAFGVAPDFAFVIEATTASDIRGVDEGKTVCNVSGGAVISFMDRGTVYDRQLFEEVLKTAKEKNIKCQVKRAVAGGNNSAGIHRTREGVRTAAISVPCRYIHSPSCAASFEDIKSVRALAEAMIMKAASGEIK